MNSLDNLIHRLSKLPGIGKKSATRLAYHILDSDESYIRGLADDLVRVKEQIHPCSVCGNYTEADPCPVCRDDRRDRSVVCIVEQAQDVAVLESTREYQGLYHVLFGTIAPLDGVGPEQLNIASLMSRLTAGTLKEAILATNPTVEGDTTALYVSRMLQERGIRTSRLALGLPVGGDLEYADRLTVARSLRMRTPLE